MKHILLFLSLILLFGYQSNAQSTNTIEMADILRSSGKIYVVVAIMSIIFIGIVLYLFTIDRRLNKIEKQHSS